MLVPTINEWSEFLNRKLMRGWFPENRLARQLQLDHLECNLHVGRVYMPVVPKQEIQRLHISFGNLDLGFNNGT